MSKSGRQDLPIGVPHLGITPPRAAAFIVTVYGDIVEPRGGILWMGSLIDICADFGITETLVRTAVSRLVDAGQLSGERTGRRSYYRLTQAARIEFSLAAKALFAPDHNHDGWLFLRRPAAVSENILLREGFVPMGPDLLIGADRERNMTLEGMVFRASLQQGKDDLPEFAQQYWQLDKYAAAYQTFMVLFKTLGQELDNGLKISGRASLSARLALVHEYRAVLLRDPRLPHAALPKDWPGGSAGRLFADLYARLSPATNAYVGSALSDPVATLPAETAATKQRLVTLNTCFPS